VNLGQVRRGRWTIGHVLTGMAVACGGASEKREGLATRPAVQQRAEEDPAAAEARRKAELAHRVVFADRISFAYVLLIQGPPGPAPSRADLQAIVKRAFADNLADREVELLLDFVMTPRRADLGSVAVPDGKEDRAEAPADPEAAQRVWATSDLLGLEVEAVPIAAVPDKALADPELTRALTPEERESLAKRQQAVVVRALYRNQNGVRGLRLLQALVRVVAAERGALVYDPDTQETTGPAVFAARRLQTSLGNVADQVAVVPFPDAAGENAVRLVTRGMRRFGSVDLELGGLPRDLAALQQATYVLHGLGLVMVKLGEFDSSGFAVEAPDTITVHYRDCAAAYGGQVALPRCQGCPEHADVHLVERPEEPHDPPGHVVARVVAPRAIGEQPGHDHRAWVQGMLGQILGRPAPP
jgi:hypothetical protein